MSQATPQATVVITTRNRKEDLRRALASVFAQSAALEVIVVDDASTDGTSEMVNSEFPLARVLRSDPSRGYIVQRNAAARAASTEFIFSLDDDAEFSTPETVTQTLAEFDHARVSAVAIPHTDTITHLGDRPGAPDGDVWCLASFTGTAYAVRRGVFLAMGGFREDLIHQGEEGDYCMRLLATGHVVRLGRAPEILHHESVRRSFERMDYYGRRNILLFAWRFTPFRWLVPHLVATSAKGLLLCLRTGRYRAPLRGMLAAWGAMLSGRAARTPVNHEVYHTFRELKKSGPQRLADFESHLPALQDFRSVTTP